jgi:hypothetical protein
MKLVKLLFTTLLILFVQLSFGQKTIVFGTVKDSITKEALPYVRVQFQNTKSAVLTDLDGNFRLETYYASDTLLFISAGYKTLKRKINLDQEQEINASLTSQLLLIEEVVISAPSEFPSTTLHKKIVANKRINNREKLDAFSYESYNKFQIDINNIGEKFQKRNIVQKLDMIMDYLDSTENGKSYLPIFLSETLSDYYFKNHPKQKVEIIKASKVTGIEQIQINQLLGEMYMEMNIYENFISMFQKDFVSPIANNASNFYKFYLEDSNYIDSRWCYKLSFKPKRSGDLTFSGHMWINDTTYAVKEIEATISEDVNINYIQGLYFKQKFNLIQKEVWMLIEEEMIADIKLSEKSKFYGFFARKKSTRKNFEINQEKEKDFYTKNGSTRYEANALQRDSNYWNQNRHIAITKQEKGINQMIDSLNNSPYFGTLKKLSYLLATGYYVKGKLEFGNLSSLFSTNPVEKYRYGIAIRTSNSFSRKIEITGKLAYGVLDNRIKHGLYVKYNTSSNQRGMLTLYNSSDIEQIGQYVGASTVGSTFNTLFRTGPLDKLTFVYKTGLNFENDFRKNWIFYAGFENKKYEALGLANYIKQSSNSFDTIKSLTSSEFNFKIRYAKEEEFISGTFDRVSLGSKYPILSLNSTIGVKGLLNSAYNYQKIEVQIEQNRNIGSLGRFKLYINAGKVFGQSVYPFLKVHEGNQSYWLTETSFNLLNYFEFVSDTYITGMFEQHWEGLLFNRIPLVKKMNLRLVSSLKSTYGSIGNKHTSDVILPDFTKRFNNIPYTEASIGIENIFKLFRFDFIWRMTHTSPSSLPFGIRGKWVINF